MDTLLLDPVTWDLVLDSSGNIARATNPYAIAQDVASEVKLFSGELYYNSTKGLPYFEQIFAQAGPSAAAILVSQAQNAALNVPETVSAKVTALFFDRTMRRLSGTLEVIDVNGAALNAQF